MKEMHQKWKLIGEFRVENNVFKTTNVFDSTAKNPARLGEEPERLLEMVPAASRR